MNYSELFKHAHQRGSNPDFAPYAYQRVLAEKSWPDLLDVPTGMGKTAAVVLAWLWKRGWRNGGRVIEADPGTPRRLVYCLPMRVLVEQTSTVIEGWLEALDLYGKPGNGKVSVTVLMGGAEDLKSWAEYPEEDMVLVGTQDMLLSRALMRGYGMSRYQWPVHFSLLHNDCIWVYDEVQLMGAGLVTSAQLEAFRRSFPLARSSRTLWVSATLNRDWLATVDLQQHVPSLKPLTVSDEDREQAGDRLNAVKNLAQGTVSLTNASGNQKGLQAYLRMLRDLILEHHDARSQTLVIVNRVERAQQLFNLLYEKRENKTDLLVHARFRAADRARQAERLRDEPGKNRIIVATQAIEAGVDISSKTLVTELAPWASLVQRFGRCNRYGEHNADGAQIIWLDIEDDAEALPYTNESLSSSREKLRELTGANASQLPPVDEARPLTAVLRRKDLLDLFNTDPDLSGFDVDVSDYIRDSDTPGIQVFWRDFDDDPNDPLQGRPVRDELCPVSMGQAKVLARRRNVIRWSWDTLDRKWVRLANDRTQRPGMTLLLRASDGGYDEVIGFEPNQKKPVTIERVALASEQDAFGEDRLSLQRKPIALADHLAHVAGQTERLCASVGEGVHAMSLIRAARWHDVGKAHPVFDASMHTCDQAPAGFLAKSPCSGRHVRPFFRHELASMLAWLAQHDGEADANLIAYLIAAHHGKVRMSLRAMPTEQADEGVKRFARGIWEGDILPALEFDGERSRETTLQLALMEIGEGRQGASWAERVVELLDGYGPFQLAWLETLVRLADWRASAEEQREP